MAVLSTVLGLVAITDSYISADQDNSEPAYFGFEARDKSWYIMQATTTGNVVARRYVQGASGYAANWTARATLTYNLPSISLA